MITRSWKPKKSLGQNFLSDNFIIAKIIQAIKLNSSQYIIEIGPGLGAITTGLLANCTKLVAIEIDHNLSEKLTKKFAENMANHQLVMINQDILKVDLISIILKYFNNAAKLDEGVSSNHKLSKIRVVGNLPYNISSPLLFKLFKYNEYWLDLNFMLQQEFATRLVANPNTKQYGRLSIMAQYHANISILFNVPPSSFKPIPKVESSMVRIVPHIDLPYVAKDYANFSSIVTTAFSYRRKTILNSLKSYCSKPFLQNLNIDPTARPEQLAIADFIKISNALVTTGKSFNEVV